MGKRQRNQSHTKRDTTDDIATDSQVLRKFIQKQSLTPVLQHPVTPKTNLQPIQDRRTWHPDKHRSLQATDGRKHRLKVAARTLAGKAQLSRPQGHLTHRIGFEAPKKLLLCIRRARRRAVLFAMKKTGKGARSRKHRNQWSNIQC